MPNLPPGYPSPDSRGRARKKYKGKVYDFGVHGSPDSIKEYRRWMEQALSEAPPTPAVRLTVAGLLAAWLSWESQDRGKDHPEVERICRAAVPLERLFGETLAEDFRLPRLREVQLAMARGSWTSEQERADLLKQRKPLDWSAGYTNKQIDRLLRIFRWAEEHGHIPDGRWHHLSAITPIRAGDRKARHLPDRKAADWQRQIVPVLSRVSPAISAMLRLILLLGARPCEILRMTPREIDRSSREDVWLLVPIEHKNTWRGDCLTKVITPEAQAVLAEWLLRCPDDDCPIFRPSHASRQPYTSEAISTAVRRACAALGVEPFTPYQIRHLAKKLATQTAGLDNARAFLGQRSLGATNAYAREQDVEAAVSTAKRVAAEVTKKAG